MHNYWILVTDPSEYSFDRLLEEGKTVWKQVRNHIGLKELRNIKKGDTILIFHNGNEKSMVGLAEAVSDPYKDPQNIESKYIVIDLRPIKKLSRPVPLWQMKTHKKLRELDIFSIPELTVYSIDEYILNEILSLAKES
jgi:predicted RNA-binding protein with PUA-like domain